MKKLVNFSQEDIDYVKSIAKQVSDPRSINGNFGKGIKKIIEDHRQNNA